MIRLLPFQVTDFEQLISWIDNEEVLAQFAGSIFTFPLTQQQLKVYLEDKDRLPYKVVTLTDMVSIGHAEIYSTNKTTAALCRILIGNPTYRSKGLCQQVVSNLLAVCFNQLLAEEVELNVFDWNTRAVSCYQRAGFSINLAKTKTRAVNGQTWTALNMSLSKSAWNYLRDQGG